MTGVQVPQAKIPRILVVDDMPDNLFLMNGLFEDRFEVITASSGREAIAVMMSANPPDMVLLDIMMPDMDGYEVLRRIRQHPPTANIPVIFLTALATKQDASLGLNLGAADYLTKPIDPELVLRRVEAHVRQTEHARRVEALSEKLSRSLAPESWQRLFHGPGLESIRFEQKVQTTLYAEPANPATFTATDHDAFLAEVEWLATRYQGIVDRFFDGAALVFFDEAASCIRMALELHRCAGDLGLRIGIRTGLCDIGTFRSDFLESCTLIGQEVRLAARVAAAAASGSIAIAPDTYESTKDELGAQLAACLVMEEFAEDGLTLTCVTPPPVKGEQVQSSFAGLGLSVSH